MQHSSSAHRHIGTSAHRHIGASVALAATAGIAPASASGGHFDGKPVIRVIAKGLDHPRRLSYDHGRLYVAEAGRGGKMCLGEGPEGPTCIGLTAAVSKVFREGDAWKHHRLVDGPSSAGAPDGGFAVGLSGVSARHGSVWGVETRAPPEAGVPTAPPWNKLGKLLSIDRGRARIAADISAVELKYNPHKTAVDSNPYAVPALPDGRGIVADAAGNDLIVVSRSGRARPFTVFRDHDKHEAVPASLALGPDGNLYVGELNGEPAKPTARAWQVDPWSGKILGWKSGFGAITGIGFNKRGDLYVSRLFAGVVTKVSGARRTDVKVPFPAGVAVDPRGGTVYVSAWSVADRDGTVLEGRKTPGSQIWKIRGF
ncbi:ScyD/ScyE family protein [Streptomyces sp. NBC_00201]|uniref:ScyD/ScyE family protein n=1 Tax=Streptomyces sp. NBC_00201 TaxID=2975679 RepID=UPI002251150C|nr:ScyD/ScyE family protein [Streptomyces sp. NBC_00201]MCX5248424.1 ScyD/ScyE family protein [Streptomyces sp. NBC_00201]